MPGPRSRSTAVAGGQRRAAAAVLGHPDRPTDSVAARSRLGGPGPRCGAPAALTIDPGIGLHGPSRQLGRAGRARCTAGSTRRPTPAYTAPDDALPPLITLSHGGPTACATADFKIGYQFWTTRGFAILDVNYGGSTGYGRAYRDRLIGNWGIVDVADCAAGAVAMGEQGLADPAAVGDQGRQRRRLHHAARPDRDRRLRRRDQPVRRRRPRESWRRDTHKFESRYLDELIGPYPEARARLSSTARRSTTSTNCRRRSCCCRAPRTRSCHRTRPR